MEINLEKEQKEMKKHWEKYNKETPKAAARQLKRDEAVLSAVRNAQFRGINVLTEADIARSNAKR